ncbi:MAG: NAD+ synthase [Candidatus Coatesbacteria bacterium]
MRVALAQLNCLVGDCPGNAAKVVAAMGNAARLGADLVVAPELAITGYPPEDLLLRRDFVEANIAGLHAVVRASRRHPRLVAAVGFADAEGGRLYNAAALIRGGRVLATYHKQLLPNYGVFDERRYFTPGTRSPVVRIGDLVLGIAICEDLWLPEGPVVVALAAAKPGLVISLNASPYEAGKGRLRERLFGREAARWGAPLAYLNLVGGQDELVFDGGSMIFDASGRVRTRGLQFDEELVVADVPVRGVPARTRRSPRPTKGAVRRPMGLLEEIFGALVLGVRDYARKNGFRGAIVGLSGGIDSALTAVLAADALGAGNVTGVSMPSRFTSEESRREARELARRLGMRFLELPIEPMHSAYLETLGVHARGPEADLTVQNLQARIRGALLMALSNRYGCLLLATGNKSEMSVGYATLYGDLAGGFAALKDVPKTLVYRIARWRNARDPRRPIPPRTFTRPPTAELKPDQRDTDSLPPYPVLDPIIRMYAEDGLSPREMIRSGCPAAAVARVVRMIEGSEYKRRQAPPGVKIQPRAYGKDRRHPITHAFVPRS